MVKLLSYKGILFDDYAENEDGTFWAEMCHEHASKFADKIANELDDGGTARGICSVCGCCNSGDDEVLHYYIDFDPKHVEFQEVAAVEELGHGWH